MLQRVIGYNQISMLDGFSGYNQILVNEEDREKTSFTTPWGTFMCPKIPFGLINARETFQRAMKLEFVGKLNKFIVIYLDDLTVFLEFDAKHIIFFKKFFERCRKIGIYLNPKK